MACISRSLPQCCSWQKAVVLTICAAAITSIVLGILAQCGVHGDLKIFKLEDLSNDVIGGMCGIGTLVLTIIAAIYFGHELNPNKAPEDKKKAPSDAPTFPASSKRKDLVWEEVAVGNLKSRLLATKVAMNSADVNEVRLQPGQILFYRDGTPAIWVQFHDGETTFTENDDFAQKLASYPNCRCYIAVKGS